MLSSKHSQLNKKAKFLSNRLQSEKKKRDLKQWKLKEFVLKQKPKLLKKFKKQKKLNAN